MSTKAELAALRAIMQADGVQSSARASKNLANVSKYLQSVHTVNPALATFADQSLVGTEVSRTLASVAAFNNASLSQWTRVGEQLALVNKAMLPEWTKLAERHRQLIKLNAAGLSTLTQLAGGTQKIAAVNSEWMRVQRSLSDLAATYPVVPAEMVLGAEEAEETDEVERPQGIEIPRERHDGAVVAVALILYGFLPSDFTQHPDADWAKAVVNFFLVAWVMVSLYYGDQSEE